MLEAGKTYTFNMNNQGTTVYVGRFIAYADDDQGRPTMFKIERQGGLITNIIAANILSVDEGDTYSMVPF